MRQGQGRLEPRFFEIVPNIGWFSLKKLVFVLYKRIGNCVISQTPVLTLRDCADFLYQDTLEKRGQL